MLKEKINAHALAQAEAHNIRLLQDVFTQKHITFIYTIRNLKERIIQHHINKTQFDI